MKDTANKSARPWYPVIEIYLHKPANCDASSDACYGSVKRGIQNFAPVSMCWIWVTISRTGEHTNRTRIMPLECDGPQMLVLLVHLQHFDHSREPLWWRSYIFHMQLGFSIPQSIWLVLKWLPVPCGSGIPLIYGTLNSSAEPKSSILLGEMMVDYGVSFTTSLDPNDRLGMSCGLFFSCWLNTC